MGSSVLVMTKGLKYINHISIILKRGVEGSLHSQIFFNFEFKINYFEYIICFPLLYLGYRLIYLLVYIRWLKLKSFNCRAYEQSLNIKVGLIIELFFSLIQGRGILSKGHIKFHTNITIIK